MFLGAAAQSYFNIAYSNQNPVEFFVSRDNFQYYGFFLLLRQITVYVKMNSVPLRAINQHRPIIIQF